METALKTLPLWPDVGRDILHISRNATYDAAAKKLIPTIRIGKTIRVPVFALQRMLEAANDRG
jgi:hypothetical protein